MLYAAAESGERDDLFVVDPFAAKPGSWRWAMCRLRGIEPRRR